MRALILLSAAALLLYVFIYAGAPDPLNVHRFAGSVMGTQYEVKLVDVSLAEEEQASLEIHIQSRLDKIDHLMSTYIPTSEVTRFNLAPVDEWFDLSKETIEVLEAAKQIATDSGGLYDFTINPLVDLWGFGSDQRIKPDIPSPESISAAREWVGYDAVELDLEKRRAIKRAPRLINLSSIAKGFGVDFIDRYLRSEGYENYLVEVGGELISRGYNPRGQVWNLGIEVPDSKGRSAYKTLRLDGKALATSGDYRNFWADQGHEYSHLISPETGRPTTHALASVSVIADSAVIADGWSTALFIMGPDIGLEYARAQGIEALFIIRTEAGFRDTSSHGFGERLTEVQ